MSAWMMVRQQAQSVHRSLFPSDALVSADALIAAAKAATNIPIIACPPGDPLLDGGEACYDAKGPRIFASDGLSPEDWVFHIAHEFGHHYLHRQKVICEIEAIDQTTPANPNSSLVGLEDDYSPKERMEAQANLFAREFLLPADKLRSTSVSAPQHAEQLAKDLGLSLALVRHQMADTFLLPAATSTPRPESAPPPPDASQKNAVEADDVPVLVRAGPGTGKTRTLVARIGHLIDQDVPPDRILALTYSNDSAADLAARIRLERSDQAARIWTGTFHAFGLELLRKYGVRIGLPIDLRLLDRPSALFEMERLLPQLELEYYLDLREPLRGLKSVLNAIGRAKDELCSAQRYTELAEAMAKQGSDPVAIAKAAEVARAYRVYDEACRVEGLVDFGDLIARSVELLETQADVLAQVRADYPHILIDEYQDMNAASRKLLTLLVRDGHGPWVVGDVRQSIYRFRGASPLNITRFNADFPGASVIDLKTNYRSRDEIITLFDAFGRTMKCAPLASPARLHADRGGGGKLAYAIAQTREAEAQGIASAIQTAIAAGTLARDHAVLGRSHSTLVRIAEHLERCGIPCLYFGNFFERPEIRDLLCVLSVAGEYEGLGLLRMASAEPFAVPKDDILRVFGFRKERSVSLLQALRVLDEIADLSTAGRAGLTKLGEVFADVAFATPPVEVLLSYLFDFGAVWQHPLNEDSIGGQQRRLAVYQLVQLALSLHPRAHGSDPKRAFLQHIRTLEVLDEEKEMRRPPAIASDLDAVQIMTVHASKGLEFPVVHIPSLSASLFPAQGRPQPCSPPPGLIPDDPVMTPGAEEEGLFYVALSRGQDGLSVSRALHYGGWSRPKPSTLLQQIEPLVQPSLVNKAPLTNIGPQPAPWPPLTSPTLSGAVPINALETYLDCPRSYYYQELLALRAAPPRQPHLQMMSCVRAGLRQLREEAPGNEAATAKAFQETWETLGPTEHPLGSTYRGQAERMLRHARASMRGTPLDVDRTLKLSGVSLNARADHVLQDGSTIVIQRLKMGRLTKGPETLRPKYAVLQATVREQTKSSVVFEHVSLLTGDRREETPTAEQIADVKAKLQGAIDDIGRGRFDPKQDARRCPTCPYFFVCPADAATL
jgi:DNA helicase-2/ATP-dependent DNA helicase PcrA